MITAIILGSILLVLSYFFIILLYLRQNRLIEMEQKQQKVLKEMEDVISSYLEEMKSENERLIVKLKSDHTMNQQQAPFDMDTNSEANYTVALENSHHAPEIAHVNSVPLSKAKKAYQQTADEETNVESDPLKKDHIEDPFIRQVLFLHAKGLPPERIAQVLNKGTTEIELLLKFRQKQN